MAVNVEGATAADIQETRRLEGVDVKISEAAAAAAAEALEHKANHNALIEEFTAKTLKSKRRPLFDSQGAEVPSATRLFDGSTLPINPNYGSMSEWDHRAAMEKKRRLERENEEWLEENKRSIGRFSSVASDWRNDLRVQDTGDPTQPAYREWTLQEIWDLIVLGGAAVDPRTLKFKVESPNASTDFVAEGFYQNPEAPEFLEMLGKLIPEEDEEEVVDEGGEALLASEFSGLDDFGAMSGIDAGSGSSDSGGGGLSPP